MKTRTRMHRLGRVALLLLAGLAFCAWAQQVPISTPPSQLEPGQYGWQPDLAPAGPVVVVVSLTEQRAYVYRNGVRIAVSTVSTGKQGYETPVGIFPILQKAREHYSNLYDDAPMPYMQRLTWSGVALHAGTLPGYPASHGCVRLPREFAERLFGITRLGMTVVVANEAFVPAEFARPGWVLPWSLPQPGPAPDYLWQPEKSMEGPLAIVLSAADRRMLVLRNGVKIGEAALRIEGAAPLGTRAYVLLEGGLPQPSRFAAGRAQLRWMPISLDGSIVDGDDPTGTLAERLRVPDRFAARVYEVLRPGDTVLVTDAPFRSGSVDRQVTVLEAGNDAGE